MVGDKVWNKAILAKEKRALAKTEATKQLEADIRMATSKMGVFGCLEVTIGFGGKERVDYMTYDTSGIFRCYEIKVTKSDFHSKHANSFVGHYNYYVLTYELYLQVADEIPDWVGCYIGQECVKKPKRQDIDSKEFTFRKTIGGRSTQVIIPYTDMLKDSIIRSLYRDSQKLNRCKSDNYVDRTRRKIEELERTMKSYKQRYNILYNNVRELLGRKALRLLMDEEIHSEEAIAERTNHESLILMGKHELAKFLYEFHSKEHPSIHAVELWLDKKEVDK